VPTEALPDCEACDKPELDPGSREAVSLYNACINQQTFNGFTGARLGLRMEAVIAAMDELEAQGYITDRARAFRRVWIIDETVNAGLNAAQP
jgi:hypothetical protein